MSILGFALALLTVQAASPTSQQDGSAKAKDPPGFLKQFGPDGTTSGSLRETFKSKTDSFFSNADFDSKNGHHYISGKSLGKCALSPADIIDLILSNPAKMFPWVDANAFKDHPTLDIGSECTFSVTDDLTTVKQIAFKDVDADTSKELDTLFGMVKSDPVKLTDKGSFYFTFSTQPTAPVPDVTSHAIIRDSSDELWLVEEGLGKPGEVKVLQEVSDYLAGVMWHRLADNVKKLFENHEVSVSGPTDGGIQLNKDDRVVFRASGSIHLGLIAGNGGPDGIDFGTTYNIFKNINHGSLVAKIGSKWCLIGSKSTWVVDSPGGMTFNVNDNNQSDNSGSYDVVFTVLRNVPPPKPASGR